MTLPFGLWFTRAFLPMFGVLIALAALLAASLALVLDSLSASGRWHLFFAGLNIFLASIVWGVWVNGRPLPEHAHRAEGATRGG